MHSHRELLNKNLREFHITLLIIGMNFQLKHQRPWLEVIFHLILVIITNGLLHDNEIMPEKSLKDLSAEKFQRLFEINTITPALIAKYFLPKLNREKTSLFRGTFRPSWKHIG